MAIYAQNSCTLSHITSVQAVYTYYHLASSTITSNMAPKDNVNPPGANTIRVTYEGDNYDWTLTEPSLIIEENGTIRDAVGTLYIIECTLFTDTTYDWGPLMTSSTYAAAKAAYNLSVQATTNAQQAIEATALLGGHFIYRNTNTVKQGVITTPSGAGVIQAINDDPANWGYNTWIGSNGIQLRTGEKAYATLNNNGLILNKGGIEAGTPRTNNFVYLSTNDYPLRQYVKTTDVAIDNQKTYYTFNNNTYTAVTSPDVSSISDYYECIQNGLTINEHTPTQNAAVVQEYILTTDEVVNNQKTYYTYDSTNDTYIVVTNPISDNLSSYYELTETFTSDSAWREVIGSNFGVDNSGNLYASNAVISGEIHATSGTIAQGIIIGNENGAHITTTNEGIEFWNNGIKTAYINGNYMYIPYSVVLNEMIVGQRTDSQTEQKVDLWSWRKMSNENLRLMWLGGEVE